MDVGIYVCMFVLATNIKCVAHYAPFCAAIHSKSVIRTSTTYGVASINSLRNEDEDDHDVVDDDDEENDKDS